MIFHNSGTFRCSATNLGLWVLGVIDNHTWKFQKFSTYGIGCIKTFTECEKKINFTETIGENNRGPSSFTARIPNYKDICDNLLHPLLAHSCHYKGHNDLIDHTRVASCHVSRFSLYFRGNPFRLTQACCCFTCSHLYFALSYSFPKYHCR